MADTEKIIRKKYDVPIWHKQKAQPRSLLSQKQPQGLV